VIVTQALNPMQVTMFMRLSFTVLIYLVKPSSLRLVEYPNYQRFQAWSFGKSKIPASCKYLSYYRILP